ncbi:MAG: redoxin domain-containing protein [Aestuariivirga sp.]
MLQTKAPEISVSQWFNTKQPLTLAKLRGRVVIIHSFQMLCSGCVSHGTPQAEKLHRMFAGNDLCVIGLHTVFEHHAAMTPVSLEAFIHEYRLTFPIGVDETGTHGAIPVTMERYAMRGTPSLVVIDRDGVIRHHGFGQQEDMAVGALVGSLLAEKTDIKERSQLAKQGCNDEGCEVTPT